MNKTCYLVTLVLLFNLFSLFTVNAEDNTVIYKNGVILYSDYKQNAKGSLIINGKSYKENIKVLLKTPIRNIWYDVDLKDKKFSKKLWFVDGLGSYEIFIMVHKYENYYSYGPEIIVNNTLELDKYLYPEMGVESDNALVREVAVNLTQDTHTDIEKARKIFNWVQENLEYDYDKYYKKKKGEYKGGSGALYSLGAKKGVCNEYATLMAAISRAAGIPAKIVVGSYDSTNKEIYHAWNELYIEDEDRWIKLDATTSDILKEEYFDNNKLFKKYIEY